ncbi:MAG: thiamine pyrophosphate-dependent dehydrogenase E1 component subunit alpha [Clostridiales Family XIII bacterium]|jgi:pyruvate dehydrogenase E1 component alpha subunit|nr:thiamine pyrophosphate-dependent dehydrogenase E1 component subunit alpha [Clostridiales Family XIII bacterium]
MKLTKDAYLSLYETMLRIRFFEETARELMLGGKLGGFLHLYSGEEAIAAGVCSELTKEDCICSTHRGHGHIIAKGGDIHKMMAELYGKATGYSQGKSGSMHIADIGMGIIGANGIVGASIPITNGVAFALRYLKKDAVAVAFFGDGASNRGTFHEALNLASVWNLPTIFICENNHFGMSTPQGRAMKLKRISDRASAYGIAGVTVDGNDPVAVKEATHEAVKRAKSGKGQSLIECVTWRHHGHYIGDPAAYKDPAEQKLWLSEERDPIPRFEARLLKEKVANAEELDGLKNKVRDVISASVAFAESSPDPSPESMYDFVYMPDEA